MSKQQNYSWYYPYSVSQLGASPLSTALLPPDTHKISDSSGQPFSKKFAIGILVRDAWDSEQNSSDILFKPIIIKVYKPAILKWFR